MNDVLLMAVLNRRQDLEKETHSSEGGVGLFIEINP